MNHQLITIILILSSCFNNTVASPTNPSAYSFQPIDTVSIPPDKVIAIHSYFSINPNTENYYEAVGYYLDPVNPSYLVYLTFDEQFQVESKLSIDFSANMEIIKVSWMKDKDYFFTLLTNQDDTVFLKVFEKNSGTEIKSYSKSGGINSDISPFKDDTKLFWI